MAAQQAIRPEGPVDTRVKRAGTGFYLKEDDSEITYRPEKSEARSQQSEELRCRYTPTFLLFFD